MYALVESYGLALVFANVFIAQLGIPLPAFPTLLAAASLASRGQASLALLVLTSVSASLLADGLWYSAGGRYGDKVLSALFRMAPGLDAHVQRIRPASGPCLLGLVIAKFLPGGSPLASTLAGVTGTSMRQFILSDSIAATCWVGAAVSVGTMMGVIGEHVFDGVKALDVRTGLHVLVLATVLVAALYAVRCQVLRRHCT